MKPLIGFLVVPIIWLAAAAESQHYQVDRTNCLAAAIAVDWALSEISPIGAPGGVQSVYQAQTFDIDEEERNVVQKRAETMRPAALDLVRATYMQVIAGQDVKPLSRRARDLDALRSACDAV